MYSFCHTPEILLHPTPMVSQLGAKTKYSQGSEGFTLSLKRAQGLECKLSLDFKLLGAGTVVLFCA